MNLEIEQGSSYTYTFNLLDMLGDPFTLTGYDARLQVRRSYGASSVLINCTLSNSKLAIVGNAVVLTLTPADTSSIRFAEAESETDEWVYDLEIVSPLSKVFKAAKGTITIHREVTR
ncbi:hypothetical protein [Leptothrix discophora]|uniref:Uncharacterized protein n=1 Tax=Leptothrix discophora TaxID=89 RepID=A0ABT9G0C8_LEPDI|nr:hypothetical protein [Leptothrix discophora]MDP4299938.1 hypothetical protein [Leptothrix discophora]